MTTTITFELNGRRVSVTADPGRTLLRVLRDDIALTGTKYGCGVGACGSCTVIVDGHPARSCQRSLESVRDREVTTIEGIERDGKLHPLQEAFIEHGALQCGYCTPGMIMNAYGLLLRDPHPTRQAIVLAMEQNLCRCGAHERIVGAIEAASRKGGAR